jgi:hypothetical protein
LAIAYELSQRETGKPRHASLNRAISTAYYALFHTLAELCAKELVGNFKPWPAFRLLYRSLDHASARRVFERAGGSDDYGAALRNIGRVFVLLQSERHQADYDPGYTPTRADTIELIDRAKDAIETARTLPPQERKLLAALLIARAR